MMTTATATSIVCLGQYYTHSSCSEVYETSTRQAGIRARQLRKLGFHTTTSAMGLQVTPLGLVKLTQVTVHSIGGRDPRDVPQMIVTRM